MGKYVFIIIWVIFSCSSCLNSKKDKVSKSNELIEEPMKSCILETSQNSDGRGCLLSKVIIYPVVLEKLAFPVIINADFNSLMEHHCFEFDLSQDTILVEVFTYFYKDITEDDILFEPFCSDIRGSNEENLVLVYSKGAKIKIYRRSQCKVDVEIMDANFDFSKYKDLPAEKITINAFSKNIDICDVPG